MPFRIGIQCKTASLSILDERSCYLLTVTEAKIIRAGNIGWHSAGVDYDTFSNKSSYSRGAKKADAHLLDKNHYCLCWRSFASAEFYPGWLAITGGLGAMV